MSNTLFDISSPLVTISITLHDMKPTGGDITHILGLISNNLFNITPYDNIDLGLDFNQLM